MDRHTEQKLTDQSNTGWNMPDKQFLTIGEVANLLQVSNRTVYNLIYKGTLRACRLTYHITLITKEDFFLMIKEATYCKRNISMFAKQCKKTKKMKKEKNTEIKAFPDKRERRSPRAARRNGSSFRQPTTSSRYGTLSRTKKMPETTFILWLRYARSSITPTDVFITSVCGIPSPA